MFACRRQNINWPQFRSKTRTSKIGEVLISNKKKKKKILSDLTSVFSFSFAKVVNYLHNIKQSGRSQRTVFRGLKIDEYYFKN